MPDRDPRVFEEAVGEAGADPLTQLIDGRTARQDIAGERQSRSHRTRRLRSRPTVPVSLKTTTFTLSPVSSWYAPSPARCIGAWNDCPEATGPLPCCDQQKRRPSMRNDRDRNRPTRYCLIDHFNTSNTPSLLAAAQMNTKSAVE